MATNTTVTKTFETTMKGDFERYYSLTRWTGTRPFLALPANLTPDQLKNAYKRFTNIVKGGNAETDKDELVSFLILDVLGESYRNTFTKQAYTCEAAIRKGAITQDGLSFCYVAPVTTRHQKEGAKLQRAKVPLSDESIALALGWFVEDYGKGFPLNMLGDEDIFKGVFAKGYVGPVANQYN